jgi:hypothetical protein
MGGAKRYPSHIIAFIRRPAKRPDVIEDIVRPTFRITPIFTMRCAMGIASLHPSYGVLSP